MLYDYIIARHFALNCVQVEVIIIPLKKGIMFFTLSLGLSVYQCVCVCMGVCVCVCHQDCDEMAGFSNTVLNEAITPDNS